MTNAASRWRPDVDAHGPGGELVLADGLERPAVPRAPHPPEPVGDDGQRRPGHPDGEDPGHRQPLRAAGPLQVEQHDAHRLGEAEGGDGQEDAAQVHRRQAQDDGGQRPDGHADHDAISSAGTSPTSSPLGGRGWRR